MNKKTIMPLFLLLILLLLIGCDVSQTDRKAPMPINVRINDHVLSWDINDNNDKNTFTVTILKNQDEYTKITYTNEYDFTELLEQHDIEFRFKIKTNSNDNYNIESDYTEEFQYLYVFEYNNLILYQDLVKHSNPPTGWIYENLGTLYADGSLKFDKSGSHLVTNHFQVYTSFNVNITIKGNNTGGNAVISVYGLDKNDQIIETVKFEGPIKATKHTITADFVSTDIVKLKLEYSTKVTGNLGVYDITIKHDDSNNVLLKIDVLEYQKTYYIGDEFDVENGLLELTYKNGLKEKIKFSDLDLLINGYNSDVFGTRLLDLTYNNITVSVEYQIIYKYDAIYENPDQVKLFYLDFDQIVVITVNNLTILIGDISDHSYPSLHNFLANNLDGTIINYYIANKIDSSVYEQLIQDFSINKYHNSLNTIEDLTYNLAPSVILSIDKINSIIVPTLEVFGKQIVFTDQTISSADFEELLLKYPYPDILSINNNRLDPLNLNNLFNANTYIINNNDFFNSPSFCDDLIKNIYKSSTNNQIFTNRYNGNIEIDINKYCYNIITNNSMAEFSTSDYWLSKPYWNQFHYIENPFEINRYNYYQSIENLTKEALQQSLNELLTTTHRYQTSYSEARYSAEITDADPNNPGNIILLYSGYSVSSSWDNGITWNREHTWPKALSGGLYPSVSNNDRGAGADLHQLKPASPSFNSSRKDKPYGPVTNEKYYEPRDEVKGDIARIIFYMSIRYNMDIEGLGVVSNLNLLIKWHQEDPVDYFEICRNEAIGKIQGNFNPFIDNPWIIELLY